MLEGTAINSLDLLQARPPVAAFEVGHEYLQTGSISIGAVTRAATANMPGVKQGTDVSECTEEIANEEWGQVWCGILVLDR
jgi:hypothetical protein